MSAYNEVSNGMCVGSDVLWLVSIADADFLENPIEGICKEVVQISSDNEGMEWANGSRLRSSLRVPVAQHPRRSLPEIGCRVPG